MGDGIEDGGEILQRNFCGDRCPLSVSLRSAEALLQEVDNPESSRALGGIAITRRALELTVQDISCGGAKFGADAQLVCPNQNMIMLARSFAVSPWNQAQFAANLDKGIVNSPAETNIGHGTYL